MTMLCGRTVGCCRSPSTGRTRRRRTTGPAIRASVAASMAGRGRWMRRTCRCEQPRHADALAGDRGRGRWSGWSGVGEAEMTTLCRRTVGCCRSPGVDWSDTGRRASGPAIRASVAAAMRPSGSASRSVSSVDAMWRSAGEVDARVVARVDRCTARRTTVRRSGRRSPADAPSASASPVGVGVECVGEAGDDDAVWSHLLMLARTSTGSTSPGAPPVQRRRGCADRGRRRGPRQPHWEGAEVTAWRGCGRSWRARRGVNAGPIHHQRRRRAVGVSDAPPPPLTVVEPRRGPAWWGDR